MQFPNFSAAKYLSRRHAELADLRAALERAQFEVIQDAGHKWKGSAVSYGFADLSQLGIKIEQAAMGRDSIKLKELIDEFESWLTAHPIPQN